MLENKTAVITGASGGIGLAVLEAYLQNGANCIATDIGPCPDQITTILKQFPERGDYLQADVTNSNHVDKLFSHAASKFTSVDILFNNAAIFDMAPLLESDEAMYDRIFDVNVKGMFFIMQAAARSMVTHSKSGAIINMASQAGRRGEALVSHYCASKAAVISYTQSAAMGLAKHNIRVNAISPGVIDTPMWATVDSLFARYENLQPGEKKHAVGEAVPLGYMGSPKDISGTAVFLASSGASYITGQTLNVDGGNVLS